jgi:transposase
VWPRYERLAEVEPGASTLKFFATQASSMWCSVCVDLTTIRPKSRVEPIADVHRPILQPDHMAE